jgi:hypothetical protein
LKSKRDAFLTGFTDASILVVKEKKGGAKTCLGELLNNEENIVTDKYD